MLCCMQVGSSGTLPKSSILCFVAMTGEAKQSHAFKFRNCLKASNTMTGFGIRLSNSCITPQNGTRNDLRRSEILGDHVPRPPYWARFACLITLCQVQRSSAHWNPSFQNPRSTTYLPIFRNVIFYNTISEFYLHAIPSYA